MPLETNSSFPFSGIHPDPFHAAGRGRRGSLKALVAQAEAHREQEIYRGWRLKEFLAHMSGWDDAVIKSLRTHKEGLPI